MYLVYSLALTVWAIIMLPVLGYRALFSKQRLPRISERLGKLPESLKADGRPTIWIHACSVGETLSAQPLASALRAEFPNARFVFSVITGAGRAVAEKKFAEYGPDCVFYFPVDLPGCVRSVLNHVRPQILICIDTEIWPNVLHECRRRAIPVFLANGRISAKSYNRYRALQPLIGFVLANYTMLLMKSEPDAERIRRMGAPASRVRVVGNIKYDHNDSAGTAADLACEIAHSFGLSSPCDPLIVAGSTHEREEEILFDVLLRLRGKSGLEHTRMLIAPRHPERFDDVATIAMQRGLRVSKRTDSKPDCEAPVLLLNAMGELAAAYSMATVAFVGGTLIPFGGHSIMEPALYSKAIVIGPSMENFSEVRDDFAERDAIVRIPSRIDNPDEQRRGLEEAFTSLLLDKPLRDKFGARAGAIYTEGRGATARCVEEIGKVFNTAVH